MNDTCFVASMLIFIAVFFASMYGLWQFVVVLIFMWLIGITDSIIKAIKESK